mmetsp:Transcript_15000/g.45403  ORF Transcript_15000/g.45403 Transcript_15000/m.45403 type:complete len:202 (+) Transcript_15000:151-756(+)
MSMAGAFWPSRPSTGSTSARSCTFSTAHCRWRSRPSAAGRGSPPSRIRRRLGSPRAALSLTTSTAAASTYPRTTSASAPSRAGPSATRPGSSAPAGPRPTPPAASSGFRSRLSTSLSCPQRGASSPWCVLLRVTTVRRCFWTDSSSGDRQLRLVRFPRLAIPPQHVSAPAPLLRRMGVIALGSSSEEGLDADFEVASGGEG